MNPQQQAKETKRYTVTLDMYVHADDDTDAQVQAMMFVANLNSAYAIDDAAILSIHETPFGSMDSRLVYGNEKIKGQ